MRPDFSFPFRQQARHYAQLLDEKIIPVIVEASQNHGKMAANDAESAAREGFDALIANRYSSLQWGLLPGETIQLRNSLRSIAENSNEWATLHSYGIGKVLEQVLAFSQNLLDIGYSPEETQALHDFLHSSKEIRNVLRKAERAEMAERLAPSIPLPLYFSEDLKSTAGKIEKSYAAESWMITEQQPRLMASPVTVEDHERIVDSSYLRAKLYSAAATLKTIAGMDNRVFPSGRNAEHALEELLYALPQILVDNGYPELQKCVETFKPELEGALELARKAARKERRECHGRGGKA